MKSSIFVTCSSLFFLAWLAASYVTNLRPEPRVGRGSVPLNARTALPKTPEVLVTEKDTDTAKNTVLNAVVD